MKLFMSGVCFHIGLPVCFPWINLPTLSCEILVFMVLVTVPSLALFSSTAFCDMEKVEFHIPNDTSQSDGVICIAVL